MSNLEEQPVIVSQVPTVGAPDLLPLYNLGKALNSPRRIGVVAGQYVLDGGSPCEGTDHLPTTEAHELVRICIEAVQKNEHFDVNFFELSTFDTDEQDSDRFYTVLYGPDRPTISAYIEQMNGNLARDENRGPLMPNPAIYKSPLYARLWEREFPCVQLSETAPTMYAGTFYPDIEKVSQGGDSRETVCRHLETFMEGVAKDLPTGSGMIDTFVLVTFSRPAPIDVKSEYAKDRGGGLFLMGKRDRERFDIWRVGLRMAHILSRAVLNMSHSSVEYRMKRRQEREAVWKGVAISAAHKIGNPIFGIETDLDPLEKRISEKRTGDAIIVLNNVRSAVEKAKRFVDQFKSIRKIQPVPLLLRPLLEECWRSAMALGIRCDIDCPETMRILGDAESLADVFDELTANTLHSLAKSDGKIWLSASVGHPDGLDGRRKYAIVHFRDNGPGVEADSKTDIFNPYISNTDQGTGLGLALVERTIEGHGGLIAEKGVPGQGADFEFSLPLEAAEGS